MPAEKGFPGADVTIRRSDSSHLDVDGVVQQGVQFVEVPGSGSVVHQSVEQVGSVYGRRKDDVFPKLSYF